MEEKCAVEKKPGWSVLWKSEDWLAVWLAFFIMAMMIAFFSWKVIDLRKIVPTYRWTTDGQIESRAAKWAGAADFIIKDAESKGETGTVARLNDLKEALAKKDRAAIEKAGTRLDRLGRDTMAGALGGDVKARAEAYPGKVFSWENLSKFLYIGIAYLIIAVIGLKFMGGVHLGKFIVGFPIVFFIAWVTRLIAGNAIALDWGLEYIIFALAISMFLSNVFRLPEWLMSAVRTEYFIKTGLVMLGSGILFSEILQLGYLGIIQALLVIIVVWYFSYWFATKVMKVDAEFATILSSAVSICGVSAAIATCGAVQGDKKKLSYTATLVIACAIPMLLLMPLAIKTFDMDHVVGGAWMGGTIDTSAAVVGAGALVSDRAMVSATIVKFTNNAFIGVAAFAIAIWWAFKKGAEAGEKPTAGIIWERFPKFVLGFLAGSIIFSFFLHPDIIAGTRSAIVELRTWWFAMAFVSIGLEARLVEMAKMGGGRPAVVFFTAQAFNILWVLGIAYLLFGGYIFPVPVVR